jgi:hypothetical protein
MSLLPTNLASRLIEDSLPWDRATQFHIRDFLEAYTLHDSNWITLHVHCGWEDSAIAIISFDPVWNQSVSAPTSHCADWPLLFLRFAWVSNIQMAGFSDIGGLQRGISSVSVEHISEEEVVTTILDHDGASVQIRHLPLVDALVMSCIEDVIQLPKHVA